MPAFLFVPPVELPLAPVLPAGGDLDLSPSSLLQAAAWCPSVEFGASPVSIRFLSGLGACAFALLFLLPLWFGGSLVFVLFAFVLMFPFQVSEEVLSG